MSSIRQKDRSGPTSAYKVNVVTIKIHRVIINVVMINKNYQLFKSASACTVTASASRCKRKK